jgi:hypothetical protein
MVICDIMCTAPFAATPTTVQLGPSGSVEIEVTWNHLGVEYASQGMLVALDRARRVPTTVRLLGVRS